MPATATALRLDVRSETAPLESVLVHTPGDEMRQVHPDNRIDLLFDDILYVGGAREEHATMCQLFAKVVGRDDAVLQITDLLREALEEADARAAFIAQLIQVERGANLRVVESDLLRFSPKELFRFALTGESPLDLEMLPLPNLMFTRDLAAVVGRHVVLSHAATAARARESAIIQTVLRFHPAFEEVRDRLIVLPGGTSFEGGDLLMASERVVLLGCSERTSFGGAMSLTRELLTHTEVEHVVIVNLPNRRSCMHLDTVFTFASEDECVFFPDIIGMEGRNNVVSYSASPDGAPDRLAAHVFSSVHAAVEELLEREVTFIPCGGEDPLSQRREQWTDGANFFAIAPGMVIGYERNDATFRAMQEHGYRVVSAEGFLQFYADSTFESGYEKLAVKLGGTELSRGRGGPRCMTLPLARKSV